MCLQSHVADINTPWTAILSPSGTRMASTSVADTISIHDATTGALQMALTGSSVRGRPVNFESVAFSPSTQTLLASGAGDGKIDIWDTVSGALRRTHQDIFTSSPIDLLAYSPNGRLLASVDLDIVVKIWNLEEDSIPWALSPENVITSLAFSLDGRHLILARIGLLIEIRDVETGTIRHALGEYTADLRIDTMVWGPHGEQLISGCSDGIIRIWDTEITIDDVNELPEGNTQVGATLLAISPDGQACVTLLRGQIALQRADTSAFLGIRQRFDLSTLVVEFSPDSMHLAIASESDSGDILTSIWNVAAGDCTLEHKLDESCFSKVDGMQFSHNGKFLVLAGLKYLSGSSSSTRCIDIWDTTTGAHLDALDCDVDTFFLRFGISPDDTRITLWSFKDGTTNIWSLLEGDTNHVFHIIDCVASAIAISPNGRELAVATNDCEIRLCSLATGEPHRILNIGAVARKMSYCENGSYLRTDKGLIRIESGKSDSGFLRGEWIIRNNEKLLWLPPAYRPKLSHWHEGKLFLGLASGRVISIGFDFSKID